MKTPFLLILFLSVGSTLHAAEATPLELNHVGIDEHLGKSISLDLPFIDEAGKEVRLRDVLDGKHPAILTLAYYGCPNLCGLLLGGVMTSLSSLPWKSGDAFQLINVSIDPTEQPLMALEKKATLITTYHAPDGEQGWHFLTGTDANIHTLADDVGFRYRYDEEQKQYAHAAVMMILTPQGKISRYLYGIQFEPRDVKLALLEASQGKIGNLVDKLLLYCYHYDPKGRKYALMATRLMKGAGGVTIFGIGLLLTTISYKRRK